MATYDSYASRYSKSRDKKMQSLSPSPIPSPQQPINDRIQDNNNIGKVVSKLSDRIDGVQIKITSLTNIVKLLQKYTQTKDQQYEKQKQNVQFKLTTTNHTRYTPQANQLQNKLTQIDLLSQRMKSEITAMESLRIGISRQNSHKNLLASPQIYTPAQRIMESNNNDIMMQVEGLMGDMQENLREQLNKKIQICMNCLKKAIQSINISPSSKQFASPKTVNSMNTVMLQEQVHNLTLTVNKLESDCVRNKMINDKKIEQIVSYIGQIKKKSLPRYINTEQQTISRSKSKKQKALNLSQTPLHKKQSQNRSETSSISKHSKSPHKTQKNNKSKSQRQNPLSTTRLLQQKKIKQNQLKQALRRKKDHQQKLKMKKF